MERSYTKLKALGNLSMPSAADFRLILCAIPLLLQAVAAPAQNQASGSAEAPRRSLHPDTSLDSQADGADPLLEQRRLRMLNIARQKSMVEDTNKLLKLVTEFNGDVARNSSDALTVAQLHKLNDIEKLARRIREKMTIPIQTIPPVEEPVNPLRH